MEVQLKTCSERIATLEKELEALEERLILLENAVQDAVETLEREDYTDSREYLSDETWE